MSRRAIRVALRLYPRPWREAHGDELEQLTDDLLRDPREKAWRITLSTTMGAVREQMRPRYDTAGRLIGLGLAVVSLALVGFGVATVVGHGPGPPPLAAAASAPGRIATLAGMESVLRTRHVRVVVDGTDVPLPEIAARTVGFAGSSPTKTDNSFSPPSFVRQGSFMVPIVRFSPVVAKKAIAYQVLTDLATRQAERNGGVVTQSVARAFAEKEYAIWLRLKTPLPDGVSGTRAFLASRAIASYRQVLTVDQELTAIAGPQSDISRTPALQRWLIRELRTNSVAIDGVPGLDPSDLASNLPGQL